MNIFKMIRKELREHRKNESLIKKDEINYKIGTNKILLSAPHTFEHERLGQVKIKDYFTYSMIRIISELSNCHIMYINKPVDYDPNYDNNHNNYYDELKKYIKEHNIEYLIDLHGLDNDEKDTDIDLGINDYKNINNDKKLVKQIISIFKSKGIKKVSVDKYFKSKSTTLTNRINNELNIKALQIEIGFEYRDIQNKLKRDNVILMINALLDIISYLENHDMYRTLRYKEVKKKDGKEVLRKTKTKKKKNEFDYSEKYDQVLDIKPAYGYKRKLPDVINYDQVGLEIEVSVQFDREKYSLIKTMLKNIKEFIGDRGYFVKDHTIIGDYNFEIVLDPLNVDEIYEIYSTLMEITKFSQGLISISKEKNCGIHMNFNKYDILDVPTAHKRLMSLLSEQEKYFEENIYKQFKFIWDYDEYYKFQKTVSSKYVWVNYLDNKLVEVRNVKTGLNANELVALIKQILDALFFDKIEGNIFDYKSFTTLNKIYDTALDQIKNDQVFDSITEDGFVLISLKDKVAHVVNVDHNLKEEIRKQL